MTELSAALRRLSRRPGQSLVLFLVLLTGLAAAVTAYTYLRAYDQEFPGVENDRLVRLFEVDAEDAFSDVSFLDYMDYAESEALSGLAVAQPYYAASVRLQEMTEVAFIEAVTGTLFDVLGVEMAHGRRLGTDDDHLASEPVAVISYAWWQTLFGGHPDVLGSTIYLNYRPFTVVGVAAPGFLGSTSDARPDVWIPIAHFRDRYTGWDTAAKDRATPLARAYGRLPWGMARQAVEEELAGIAAGLDAAYPRESGPRTVRVASATWIDPRTRAAEANTVTAIVAAAAGLLLLVCANVANMLLALSTQRRREMAARAALGASPWRLVQQGLVENCILAFFAGLVALGLAGPLTGRLGSYFARPSVWGENVSRQVVVDGSVVLFSVLVAAAAGVTAALLPALRASRTSIAGILRSGDGSPPPGTTLWGRRLPRADWLVSMQTALSVVLLVVAGLVARTLAAAGDVAPGFEYRNVISSHISTSSTDMDPTDRGAFFETLVRDLEAEPWVRSVAVKDNALLSGQAEGEFRIEGRGDDVIAGVTRILPGFFEKLDIRLTEGRGFEPGDTAGAPGVVILSEEAVARFFDTGRAVGRRIWWPADGSSDAREFEVVGVAADVRATNVLLPPDPAVFLAYHQHPYPSGSALHVRTSGDPSASVSRLERWLRAYEPYLAIVNVLTYRDVVAGSLYAQRMNAELFGVLAILAVLLAAFGIFSVLSLSIGRRTREIGVRMALGAHPRLIGQQILQHTLTPVIVGLGAGIVVAYAARNLMGGLLYGISPTDAPTWAAGIGTLLAVASLAAWFPARRAARLDPVAALREGG